MCNGIMYDSKILDVFQSEESVEKYVSLVDTDNNYYEIEEYDLKEELPLLS